MMKVLIVDDEPNIRKTLSYCLSSSGHEVIAVSNYDDALEEGKNHSFVMALVDLKLGDRDGMELIPALLAESPWLKIIVITAYSSVETAVESIKQGAYDYIAKPFTVAQIKALAERVLKIHKLEKENQELKSGLAQINPELFISSSNPKMQSTINTLSTAAASDAIILLLGESGTGKTVLAKAVHNWSLRADKPFGVLSCPAVPSELLESELFGHVKGAFTGAVRENPGRIAACEGGTLFLDEVGEIPLNLQVKLLRFIQEKEYERIGESTPRKADVRIIAATNIDLSKAVRNGDFREDLYYRLNVINVTIPGLKERSEDIIPLAENFLRYFNRNNHKSIRFINDEAKNILLNYNWPGNIRELRNYIERAVILGNRDHIGVEDLPENVSPGSNVLNIGDRISLSKIEESHIRKIIASTHSLQEASEVLGIDQATLWRKRKSLGI